MNELHTIGEQTKPFLDWCKEYEASPVQVRARMSLDTPLLEALTCKNDRRVIFFRHNGYTKTLVEWAELHNIAEERLRDRLHRGFTLKEALDTPPYLTNKVTRRAAKGQGCHHSTEYSITQPFLSWCEDYAADPMAVRASMSMGRSIEYALRKPPKPNEVVVCLLGNVDTLVYMLKRHKKSYNTIRRRVDIGMTLEDAFTHPHFKQYEFEDYKKSLNVNEPHTITMTLTEWCRDYRKSERTVLANLDAGLTLGEALHWSEKGVKKNIHPLNGDALYTHDGRTQSLQAWADESHLRLRTVQARMQKGIPFPQALQRQRRLRFIKTSTGRIIPNDVLADKLDVSPYSVQMRIANGESAEKAMRQTVNAAIRHRQLINGNIVREKRMMLGMSQAELARQMSEIVKLPLSKYVPLNIEHNKRRTSNLELDALCQILHLNKAELLGDNTEDDTIECKVS